MTNENMTTLEALTYVHACAFMRAIKSSPTTWADDCDTDPHLKEALEVLGLKPDDDRLKET